MEDLRLPDEAVPIMQGIIAENIGKGERAELDPFEFAIALIKNRKKKYEEALEVIGDTQLTFQEKQERLFSFEADEQGKKPSQEECGDFLVESTRKSVEPVIDTYTIMMQIIDKIKTEQDEHLKNKKINDLYYWISFKEKRHIYIDEVIFKEVGFAIKAYENEYVFYNIIGDLIYKHASKPYSFVSKHLVFIKSGGALVPEITLPKLLEETTESVNKILKEHPFAKYIRNKDLFRGKAKEKIEEVHAQWNLLASLKKSTPKFQTQIQTIRGPGNYFGYEIDENQKESIEYFHIYGSAVEAILEETKKHLLDCDQWLRDNFSLVSASLSKEEKKALHEYLYPKTEKKPVPAERTKKSSKKNGYKPVEIIVPSPPREPKRADIKPVIYRRSLSPIQDHVPNEGPVKEKEKTKGTPYVSTETTAEEDKGAPAAPGFYIEEVDKSSWIWTALHGKHPDYNYIKKEFSDFLESENLAGEWVEKENKGAIAIVSPIDGETYVETFHISHGPVNESSRPSWRHAVCDVLKAASIVRS